MDQTLDQLIKERKIGFRGRGGFRYGGSRRGYSNNRGFGGRGRGFNTRGRSSFQQRGQMRQRRGFANRRGFGNRGFSNFRGQRRGFYNFESQRGAFGRGRGAGYRRGGFNQSPMLRPSYNRPGFFGVRRGGVMKRQMGGFRNAGQMVNSTPAKLYISNLDFGVTNEDIKELFTEFGRVRRYGVNFAQGGQSLGTAEVQYENRSSALRAIQKYNNVPLDGRPMKLAVSGPSRNDTTVVSPTSRMMQQPVRNNFRGVGRGVSKKLVERSKNTLMRGRGRGGAGRGFRGSFGRGGRGGAFRGRRGQMRGRGSGSGRGRGGKKPETPTQEQLDADLDEFTAQS